MNFILKYSLAVLFMAMVVGCGHEKKLAQGESQVAAEKTQPTWVSQRPMDPSSYIGIGSCSKKTEPIDYQNVAKKNALNDLTTEISVKVQGSTFLNSLESNKNFSEEFISTISTTTDEKIENFEVAGIWEDKNQYWIYYRLSKDEYQRQKAEKKNAAMSSSADLFKRGLEAEKNNQLNFLSYTVFIFNMK